MTERLAYVMGVDPGPIPGIVAAHYIDGLRAADPTVIQCNHQIAPFIVEELLGEAARVPRLLALETFRVSGRSARCSTPKAGELTRNLLGALIELARRLDIRVVERTASDVKPFATDDRLRKAGLYVPTEGMRHARDGARHHLFAAIRDGIIPDPLSRRER